MQYCSSYKYKPRYWNRSLFVRTSTWIAYFASIHFYYKLFLQNCLLLHFQYNTNHIWAVFSWCFALIMGVMRELFLMFKHVLKDFLMGCVYTVHKCKTLSSVDNILIFIGPKITFGRLLAILSENFIIKWEFNPIWTSHTPIQEKFSPK